MINKLYSYYFYNLTMYRLVWCKILNTRLKKYVFFALPFLTSILCYNLLRAELAMIVLAAFIGSFILYFEFRQRSYVLKNYSNIKVEKFFIDGETLDDYRKVYLQAFLYNEGIVEKEQYEFLINLLEKKIEEYKTPHFLKSGFVAAILLPGWASIVTWLFDADRLGGDYQSLSSGIITYAIAVAFLLILGYMLRELYSLKNNRYDIYRKINELISEIYLSSKLKKCDLQSEEEPSFKTTLAMSSKGAFL